MKIVWLYRFFVWYCSVLANVQYCVGPHCVTFWKATDVSRRVVMTASEPDNSSNESANVHVRLYNSSEKEVQMDPAAVKGSCEGLIGVFCTAKGPYASVILDSTLSSTIGKGVRRINEIGLIRIPGRSSNDGSKGRDTVIAKPERETDFHLMEDAYSKHSFYYSSLPQEFDVTRNTQSNALCPNKTMQSPICACDSRFCWNYDIASLVVRAGGGDMISPICNIWTDTIPIKHEEQYHNFTIVSRRSRLRQGPRFLKRGIDRDGNVANFVETEQILKTPRSEIFSFVQIRGSLPLFWSQVQEKMLLKPKIHLTKSIEDPVLVEACRRHFLELYEKYCMNSAIENKDSSCGVAIVNLIDKCGIQLKMGNILNDTIYSMRAKRTDDYSITEEYPPSENFREELYKARFIIPNARGGIPLENVWFDYHFNVDTFGLRSLNSLYPVVHEYLEGPSECCRTKPGGNFYFSNRNGEIGHLQNGIIRTNCVDCLDRTNIVQFSKWALIRQLNAISRSQTKKFVKKENLLPEHNAPSEKILKKTESLAQFRRLWADHGDAMSMLYAGTRALKRDMTLFGKRTGMGIIGDGVTFWQRYINSNFRDSKRQRGINAILGKRSTV